MSLRARTGEGGDGGGRGGHCWSYDGNIPCAFTLYDMRPALRRQAQ
jgi:hypothetical protein